VRIEGDVVSGELANHASHPVRNVNVLIQHAFRWNNEFRPGKDNPSRAEYYTVAGEIPAGGSAHFSMHLAEPLPTREDGSFVTRAMVAGYTEVGATTSSNDGTVTRLRCVARGGVLSEDLAQAYPCGLLRIGYQAR
jgi:hypothetical protein